MTTPTTNQQTAAPAAGTSGTWLPFRVLIHARNGSLLISEPLAELPARLLVRGALRSGDDARIVENHRPRHRWGEQAFAAGQLETVHVVTECTCSKCTPQQFAVGLAHVPIDLQCPPPAVSRESAPAIASEARPWRGIAWDAIRGLALGALAGLVVNVLIRLLAHLVVGGGP